MNRIWLTANSRTALIHNDKRAAFPLSLGAGIMMKVSAPFKASSCLLLPARLQASGSGTVSRPPPTPLKRPVQAGAAILLSANRIKDFWAAYLKNIWVI